MVCERFRSGFENKHFVSTLTHKNCLIKLTQGMQAGGTMTLCGACEFELRRRTTLMLVMLLGATNLEFFFSLVLIKKLWLKIQSWLLLFLLVGK